MRPNVIISVGSFNAALAIALSAYAAHGLEQYLDTAKVTTFTTGADFHLWHSLGLILIGSLAKQFSTISFSKIALLLVAGITLFSGSHYLLSTTGIKLFAYITPFGGIALIITWCWLALLMLSYRAAD